jgi:putative tryptophan/tyrosine transport system substrate-binding protein
LSGRIKGREKAVIIWACLLNLLFIIFGGCKAPEKIYIVGIASELSETDQSIKGFKAGMDELGYVEGKNIRYIFNRILESDKQKADAAIKELLAQHIDLLITMGNLMDLRAKKLVADLPVLFIANASPVEYGLVESMNHPGGNMTGITPADSIPKALEWLTRVVPKVKKIYLPYDPNDVVPLIDVSTLNKAAFQMGIELVPHQIHSVEETVEAIKGLPKDIDAVFMVPSGTLNLRNIELSKAALSRGIPTGASLLLDESVLVTFTSDFVNAGKQAARLAQQIFQGAKPADLPVETAEVKLIINLKTAEKIGLTIPDDILAQATTIIH